MKLEFSYTDTNSDSQSDDGGKTPEVHNLPFTINFNGQATVSKSFGPYISHEKDLQASFRGHLLSGEEIKIPENHTAFIMKEHKGNESEKLLKGKNLDLNKNSFILWKEDAQPHSGEMLKQSFKWFDYANEIHK